MGVINVVSYSFFSSVKNGINLVSSLAFVFKNSAETLLTVQLQHENICTERNYKNLHVFHLLCHRETGKSRSWAGCFLIVEEFCKGRKVATSLLI